MEGNNSPREESKAQRSFLFLAELSFFSPNPFLARKKRTEVAAGDRHNRINKVEHQFFSFLPALAIFSPSLTKLAQSGLFSNFVKDVERLDH